MTAPAVLADLTFDEAAATGAGTIARARGILARARACPMPDDDDQARADIRNAVWYLADSLRAYWNLASGIVLPQDEIPGLEPGPDAFADALARVAADAGKDADELVRVIGRHCGGEAAATVSGEAVLTAIEGEN